MKQLNGIYTQHINKKYQEYGYTLKEIAEYLGVHYTTVSKLIKRGENEE